MNFLRFTTIAPNTYPAASKTQMLDWQGKINTFDAPQKKAWNQKKTEIIIFSHRGLSCL